MLIHSKAQFGIFKLLSLHCVCMNLAMSVQESKTMANRFSWRQWIANIHSSSSFSSGVYNFFTYTRVGSAERWKPWIIHWFAVFVKNADTFSPSGVAEDDWKLYNFLNESRLDSRRLCCAFILTRVTDNGKSFMRNANIHSLSSFSSVGKSTAVFFTSLLMAVRDWKNAESLGLFIGLQYLWKVWTHFRRRVS